MFITKLNAIIFVTKPLQNVLRFCDNVTNDLWLKNPALSWSTPMTCYFRLVVVLFTLLPVLTPGVESPV